MKRFVFCTLRPNKGATGGPGGVLFLQQEILGNKIDGISCEYHFMKIPLGNGRLSIFLNKQIFRILFLIKRNSYFITHDIETAVMLHNQKRNYSLIYHQQGPIVYEDLKLGKSLNESQIKLKKKKERMAFVGAKSLHFPSKGAEDMYFENEYRSCEREEVILGVPLYNTILPCEVEKIEGVKKEEKALTFFSLGTLTESKGQDLVLEFLDVFLSKYQGDVVYYVVGNGPMKTVLIDGWNDLTKKYSNFTYHYYENLPHNQVMYIHRIADVYIMLHRLSIFDFATLEAMCNNSVVILSKVGGNLDFNKKDNILFMQTDYNIVVDNLLKMDILKNKNLNEEVFQDFFSPIAFKQEYQRLLSSVCVL